LPSGAERYRTGVQCSNSVIFREVGMNARCAMFAGIMQARSLVVVMAGQIVYFGGFAKGLLQRWGGS
jgi:hypothetical protein